MIEKRIRAEGVYTANTLNGRHNMSFLINVLLMLVAGFVIQYWWQSGEYKGHALKLALAYCQQYDLQLLDQSMVIKGYWPKKSKRGIWVIQRTYNFEFTSTGQQRYQGKLVLEGLALDGIELEIYQLPEV